MKIAVAALIGFILSLGQNATSEVLEGRDQPEEPSRPGYVLVSPGTSIYFHAIKNGNLMIGPRLTSDDGVTIYILGMKNDDRVRKPLKYTVLKSGVLVPKTDDSGDVDNRHVYKSRELTFYLKGFKGILIPINLLYSKSKQRAIIDSEALMAKKLVESRDEVIRQSHHEKPMMKKNKKYEPLSELKTKKTSLDFKPKFPIGPVSGLTPDKNCNGEVTMFVLKSDGVLKRMPPDPYLPMGIQLSFTVKDNFLIRPRTFENSEYSTVNYKTGENGDLIPSSDNNVKVQTEEGQLVSFILGECGSLIPVHEEYSDDQQISYYYNGQLIYKGQQFPQIISNSEFVVINGQKHKLPGKEGDTKESQKHSVRKRSIYADELLINARPPPKFYSTNLPIRPPARSISRDLVLQSSVPMRLKPPIIRRPTQTIFIRQPPPPPTVPPEYAPISVLPATGGPLPPHLGIPISVEQEIPAIVGSAETSIEIPPRIRVRTDLFAIDDKGIKIPLIPEITDQNDVVLYKLTCKGNLVRFPPCKEPEFGFEIYFQLLLDEFIMVPVTKNNRPMHITYILQENGDLFPCESNENTFKKAPGSLIYFMLGKNNVLFPVQQKVDPDGSVTFFYQDYPLLKLPSTANKPLHFSTLSRPVFAFFNGVTAITGSSKPRLSSSRGSNWRNPCSDPQAEEPLSKDIFLSGPCGQLIRVTPYKTKSGSTVIYEMDSNGILYRSPKDKKKCIILKSYILLKEGILLPSNDTTGYMYMTSKNGDMFPYLFPDGKLQAPTGDSLKYLLCEKGILLPMELEIIDNYICYFFRDVVVYKERVFTKEALENMSCQEMKLYYRNDCDESRKKCDKSCKGELKLFTGDNGEVVYYEKSDRLLKRHPPDDVPPYLSYTMGSFELQPDGSLFQIRYQDPDNDVINLMLEPNGDLLEDTRNEVNPKSSFYVLDANGNLIAVESRKTKKSIYFYKDHVKVCKVKLEDGDRMEEETKSETKKTPLGRDPFKLMEDPEPEKQENDSEPESLYIPVPLKSLAIPSPEDIKNMEKPSCDGAKETMALELEINDEVIEEIKNWAAKCDKLLSRREVEESLSDALKGVNVAGLLKEEAKSR